MKDEEDYKSQKEKGMELNGVRKVIIEKYTN